MDSIVKTEFDNGEYRDYSVQDVKVECDDAELFDDETEDEDYNVDEYEVGPERVIQVTCPEVINLEDNEANGVVKTRGQQINQRPIEPEVCGYCLRCFDSEDKLLEHLRTHNENSDKPSDDAAASTEKETPQNDILASASMESFADPNQPVEVSPEVCGYCLKGFRHEYQLVEHLKDHMQRDKVSHKSNDLVVQRVDAKPQGDEKRHECDACLKRFRSELALVYHECKKANYSPNPRFKPRVSSLRKRPSTGKKVSNDQKSCECKTCKKLFISELALYKHTWTHRKQHECHLCNKKFSFLAVLKNHLLTHTGEKPYECQICHKRFSREGTLSVHRATHKPITERAILCDLCGKQLLSVTSLNYHYRTHDVNVERPFECDVCQMRFFMRSYLARHMRKHTKERPFKCDVCNKGFTESFTLRCHMRIHTGEKPHKCRFCETRFRIRSILIQHERIHTGEKPYKCKQCDKCFTVQASLIQHTQTHNRHT